MTRALQKTMKRSASHLPPRQVVCGFVAFAWLAPAALLAAPAFLDSFGKHTGGSSLAGAIPEIGDSWTVLEGAFERQFVQS